MQVQFIDLFDIIHAAKGYPELVIEVLCFRIENLKKFSFFKRQ